jgi:hypothetical protein
MFFLFDTSAARPVVRILWIWCSGLPNLPSDPDEEHSGIKRFFAIHLETSHVQSRIGELASAFDRGQWLNDVIYQYKLFCFSPLNDRALLSAPFKKVSASDSDRGELPILRV